MTNSPNRDSKGFYISNGLAAFLFSSTGPVAIILSVAVAGGLSDQHVASWLFGGFGITSLFTLYFSLRYRQPAVFVWTIPGTVLLASALDHLTFEEVVGAYLVTAALVFAIGRSGLVEKMMNLIPKPIVMAMVAGIFLDFGLGIIHAFDDAFWIAASMCTAFILTTLLPIGRLIPGILAALVTGAVVVVTTDSLQSAAPLTSFITTPLWITPSFTLSAMLELVIPLAITVLVVQNGQGFAVIRHAGHTPPMNAMTMACGLGSVPLALVGSVTMCVGGPANAILTASGKREYQYIGALTFGILAFVFGLFSSSATWLALQLPLAYIAVLGGLAVWKVLESAFVAAFSSKDIAGPLLTLLITVSDISIANIGAPFWALVFGGGLSGLLARADSA